jgi:hypothetical protein
MPTGTFPARGLVSNRSGHLWRIEIPGPLSAGGSGRRLAAGIFWRFGHWRLVPGLGVADKMMTTGGTVALGVSGVDVDVRFSHDSDEGEVLDGG